MDANMKVCIYYLFVWIGAIEEVRRRIECGCRNKKESYLGNANPWDNAVDGSESGFTSQALTVETWIHKEPVEVFRV